MKEWNVYPEDWMESDPTHHAMISYIEGLQDEGWAIMCSSFNPNPLFGHPEWQAEYDLGYRWYVIRYNLFDRGKDAVDFYKDPRKAQEAFEKLRDPLGEHS